MVSFSCAFYHRICFSSLYKLNSYDCVYHHHRCCQYYYYCRRPLAFPTACSFDCFFFLNYNQIPTYSTLWICSFHWFRPPSTWFCFDQSAAWSHTGLGASSMSPGRCYEMISCVRGCAACVYNGWSPHKCSDKRAMSGSKFERIKARINKTQRPRHVVDLGLQARLPLLEVCMQDPQYYHLYDIFIVHFYNNENIYM